MENSKIQWTDDTVNFWQGCKKVSEACKFCYMYRDMNRYGKDATKIVRSSDATFYSALKKKKPLKLFTCSWSDFFIEEADEWRSDAWEVIRKTPQHSWQILTKRPERIKECLPPDWGEGWDNVWLGVTVESQKYMSRAAILADIPAKIRFISAEPLLEETDFLESFDGKRIIDSFHWLVLGGESGNETGKFRYRPSELAWYERAINDLKRETSVAIFMKQLGTHLHHSMGLEDRHGGDLDEWPDHIKIREFPKPNIEFETE